MKKELMKIRQIMLANEMKEQIEKQWMSKKNCLGKVESIFSEKEVDGSIKWDFWGGLPGSPINEQI